jgi:hypothetical protein
MVPSGRVSTVLLCLGVSRGFVRTIAWGLGPSLGLALNLAACVAEYEDWVPPGLDEVPEIDRDGLGGDDDILVYERELRWWTGPTAQRVRLFRRANGDYVLLRQRLQGDEVYGWAEAGLTNAGATRLAGALASVDPSLDEPAPGDYGCTYVDALPATIYLEDPADLEETLRFDYLALCPPEGVVELASFYADVVDLLLECPLDGSWYAGELPVSSIDCAG